MLSLNDRVRLVVVAVSPERGRPRFLEERTNLPAESWKKFLLERQRATLEMVEAVCREWPEHAFWIATGLTDVEHGHISGPGTSPLIEPMEEVVEQSKRYFKLQRQMLPTLTQYMQSSEGAFNSEDDSPEDRLKKRKGWYNEACGLVLTEPGAYEQVGAQRRLRVTEISSQRPYFDELHGMTSFEVLDRNHRKRSGKS